MATLFMLEVPQACYPFGVAKLVPVSAAVIIDLCLRFDPLMGHKSAHYK